MTDVISTPVNDSSAPPPTIKASVESKNDWVQRVLDSGTPVAEENLPQRSGPDALNDDDSAVFGSDEQGIRRASRALRRAREAAIGSLVTEDGYDPKAPTVERKYSKDKDTPVS